jgi:formylglycine-generating enzyme required for sulfatase activity
LYYSHPDPGVHSAIAWTLRKWNEEERLGELEETLKETEQQLAQRDDDARRWYVNTQGLTFSILKAERFRMGSPETEAGRVPSEVLHTRTIGRTFAISTKEVTRGQFDRFRQEHPEIVEVDIDRHSRSDDSPQLHVTWYDAVAYCNWLSEQEGIPRDQWCYLPNRDGRYAEGMKPAPDYLKRVGYRLPSEAEWEFASRAIGVTATHFGESAEFLEYYGWHVWNSEDRSWPGGLLKPNGFGLFDMLGNAREWCHERYAAYPEQTGDVILDSGDTAVVKNADARVLRGSSFQNMAPHLRSAYRNMNKPNNGYLFLGFRVARTHH